MILAYMCQALCIRYCSKHITHINSLSLHQLKAANAYVVHVCARYVVLIHSKSICSTPFHPYFTDRETEAQRSSEFS